MRTLRLTALALVGALTLAGCGDDDGLSSGTLGEFTGTITGEFTADLEGNAIFSVDQNDDLFELALVDAPIASPPVVITLGRIGGAALPPPNSESTIGTGAGNITGSLYVQATDKSYNFTAGSLSVTSVSEDAVVGTFTFTGRHGSDPTTITVSGEFRAECVEDAEEGITCS